MRFSKELKNFIDKAEWVFAKTYADTWPHHYIVRDKVDESLFLTMVRHIRKFGYEGRFYKKKIIYFEEDSLVYWTMGAAVDQTTIINRCPKENTYEYRLRAGTLPEDMEKSSKQFTSTESDDTRLNVELWQIFSEWQPPEEKQIPNKSWDVFDAVIPYYQRIIENRYKLLNSLLGKWDDRLNELGGDCTWFDWDSFRPLRLNREEDWSDWLAHIIATSETGIFAQNLLKIPKFTASGYIKPEKVERELSYGEFRADLIIKWQNQFYSHIEVKIGDSNLQKTFETSENFRRKYKVSNDRWSNFILLLSEQLNQWQQLEKMHNHIKIESLLWEDVCIAVRRALLSKEKITWKVWAYSFLGAVEQLLVGFSGHQISKKPSENLDDKISILSKGLNYG